jgi:hypothetical protein
LPRGDRHERDPLEAIDLVDHQSGNLAGLPVQSRPRSGAGELHLIGDSTGLKLPVIHRRMSDLGIKIRTLKISGIEMA